ncbi:hypothetical protein [Streptomyces zaomyceticus]|uniref:hypothetical protein n=1 Tax=Streptomyces zaomyceticus TaxID=68286 RepID=UPI00342E2B3E
MATHSSEPRVDVSTDPWTDAEGPGKEQGSAPEPLRQEALFTPPLREDTARKVNKPNTVWQLTGAFAYEGETATGTAAVYYGLDADGEFSRDGREDVIARERATGKLWVYPGTSRGSLGARKLIGTGGWNTMDRWNAMDHILGVGDTSGDGRPALEASDGFSLYQYQGLASGGLRRVDNYNGTRWALEGVTAF